MIEAVLFDMDGVLADTEPVAKTLGVKYYRSIGREIDAAAFDKFMGSGDYAFFTGPAKENGWPFDYSKVAQFFKANYGKAIEGLDIAEPGAVRVLKQIRAAGVKCAVVSSAERWKVELNIKALALSDEDFDAVVSGECVKRNKPFPDIYLNAAIRLGVEFENCLVVEDSKNGIIAGKKAGMRVLALLTSENAEVVASAGADCIVSSLAALPEITKPSDLEDFIKGDEKDDRVVYGANYIRPLKRKGRDEDTLSRMIRLAGWARENAYAPFSHFKVGAAILSAATGKIYTGCNVENSSYGATNCAERTAIFKAISEEGAIGIDILVVVSDDDPPSPPCAICRQVLSEFCKSDTKVYLVDIKGNVKEFVFSDLLPHPFIMPELRH